MRACGIECFSLSLGGLSARAVRWGDLRCERRAAVLDAPVQRTGRPERASLVLHAVAGYLAQRFAVGQLSSGRGAGEKWARGLGQHALRRGRPTVGASARTFASRSSLMRAWSVPMPVRAVRGVVRQFTAHGQKGCVCERERERAGGKTTHRGTPSRAPTHRSSGSAPCDTGSAASRPTRR